MHGPTHDHVAAVEAFTEHPAQLAEVRASSVSALHCSVYTYIRCNKCASKCGCKSGSKHVSPSWTGMHTYMKGTCFTVHWLLLKPQNRSADVT